MRVQELSVLASVEDNLKILSTAIAEGKTSNQAKDACWRKVRAEWKRSYPGYRVRTRVFYFKRIT